MSTHKVEKFCKEIMKIFYLDVNLIKKYVSGDISIIQYGEMAENFRNFSNTY